MWMMVICMILNRGSILIVGLFMMVLLRLLCWLIRRVGILRVLSKGSGLRSIMR